MPLVKAQCTNCGAALEVDNSKDAAICPFCQTAYIVEKAIQNYSIQSATIHANAINVQSGPSIEEQVKTVSEMIDIYEFGNAGRILNTVLTCAPKNIDARLQEIRLLFIIHQHKMWNHGDIHRLDVAILALQQSGQNIDKVQQERNRIIKDYRIRCEQAEKEITNLQTELSKYTKRYKFLVGNSIKDVKNTKKYVELNDAIAKQEALLEILQSEESTF